ncbi:hypothetical protein GC197_17795 [bacterium]|nr:hypothetical protein [bacterium]
MIRKYNELMSSTDSSLDPYDRLLRIKTEGKTPDFYTLLKLEPYEDNLNFITNHGEKARKQLHSKFGEVDPAMWRQVFNQVEDAIATLTDPQKKEAYDKTLDTDQNGAALKNSATSNGSGANGSVGASELGDRIQCRKCSTVNPPSRRFCSECGDALYVACPECGGMNTVHERFCGQCGVNLQASATAQREALESKFDEAEALVKDGRHDRACDVLRTMTRAQHEGEIEFSKRAATMITQITMEKERLIARAPEVEAEATQLRNGKHAEKAVSLIREIPKVLWPASLKELYEEVNETKRQIKRLAQEIKLAIQERRTSRLLPKVEKLLELKPHDVSAQRLAEKLRKSQDQADRLKREKLVEKAKQYIKSFRYERAYQILTEVPESVRTENFLKFFDQVSELAFLASDLRRSVYADPTLVGMASRLVKLMPKDKHAIDRLHKITQKWEQFKKNPSASRVWNAPPEKTTLRVPIDIYPRFRKFDPSAVADSEHFENFSSGFIIATGLALQGLGLAKIETNLLPVTGGGVFGLLGAGKKSPTGNLAWGIDLSNSGLKAVLLRKEVQGEKKDANTTVHIERMVRVEYKRPLSRADDADRRGLIQDAIEQFFETVGNDVFNDKRGKPIVCLSLPAADVLGRFLALPPVEDKKIPKTVQYEVRHQIPFPIEELSWDYHVWDDNLSDSEQMNLESDAKRYCVVVATRLTKLQERLAFLRGLGITPNLVQTDQMAIYNFFDFDLFSDESYREQMVDTEQALGILDIGSDASHMVVCSPNSIWFRSLEVGGENFTRILVRQLSLTFTKAEELKKKPDTADEIYKLFDVVEPVLKNISKEASHTLNTYDGLDKERLAEIKLIGGGSYMHGLLTFLQYGKFLDS